MAEKKKKDVSYPNEPRIVITTVLKPEHDNFKRYLSFKGHKGSWKRLAVEFRKTAHNVYESDSFPDGIDVLRSLADTGNRNYWDDMYLENRGGSTMLSIKHLLIEMNYDNPSGPSPRGIDHGKIPIVDAHWRTRLRAGNHCLSLNRVAQRARRRWAGVTNRAAKVVRMVADDLGKSGSDGRRQDNYGKNPKYRGRVTDLCSEFVSWYYYEAGISVGGNDLRDIKGAQKLHDLFLSSQRLFFYQSSTNTWRRVDNSRRIYTPKAGDYLERRGPAGAEHSMMMLDWDYSAKEAVVFNGPWPVTLRRVRIDHDERENDKMFFVGRVTF